MANKQRLIDANAFKGLICECCNILHSDDPCEPSECSVMELIDSQPTVDAEEVVRCKDCKDWIEKCTTTGIPFAYCYCDRTKAFFKKDDFCSYGKRREGE